jgi:hypothetical protein
VIEVMLRDLRGRLALVLLLCVILYFLEPGFHDHGPVDPELASEMGPLGVSATLAYLAGLAMIVLLAGFVSTDRREGYGAILFSHPTSPLAYYGLRWGLAVALALVAALVFLLLGQMVAWGEVRGGGAGMLLPLLTALIYGGLMAFFSTVLRRGDAWVVFLLFLPTFFPQLLALLEGALPAGVHALLLFLLPPQGALQEVYRGLLLGDVVWPAAVFAAGYGIVWLALAVAVLRMRGSA